MRTSYVALTSPQLAQFLKDLRVEPVEPLPDERSRQGVVPPK